MSAPVLVDLPLARDLEGAEGAVGVAFAETRQRLEPAHGSAWCELGGASVVYDGASSAMTQTFGLGLHEPATDSVLDAIEAFFTARGADTHHEVSPLAGVETTARLVARGYTPIEMSSVLVQALAARAWSDPPPSAARVREVAPGEAPAFIAASIAGWAMPPELAPVLRGFITIASVNPALVNLVVEQDGAIIATGSLGIRGDVALLAGASTVPTARGRGAQALLLSARLAEAARRGCRLAMMAAEPGSTSQRNGERNGFRIAYTRTKWRRALTST